ncbi:hypothetical protein KC345_g41 [Hortaea werneckii]|nr:hypothetical protein KC345_g41 [Hortaea werneckii]
MHRSEYVCPRLLALPAFSLRPPFLEPDALPFHGPASLSTCVDLFVPVVSAALIFSKYSFTREQNRLDGVRREHVVEITPEVFNQRLDIFSIHFFELGKV